MNYSLIILNKYPVYIAVSNSWLIKQSLDSPWKFIRKTRLHHWQLYQGHRLSNEIKYSTSIVYKNELVMKPQFKQFPWYMMNWSDSTHSTQWSQDELAAICQENIKI